MAQATTAILHFNRGIISRLAHARIDIKRTAFSAEQMTNFIPRVLGSMMLRPGLEFIGTVPAKPKFIDFVFGTDDTALLELTSVSMRVWLNDTLIARPSVSSVITNGTFDLDIAGWTDDDEGGAAASTWATGGYMQLLGDGTNAAIREQQVTVAVADQNVEHALRIVIQRGPVTLRVGSTSDGDDYISETDLATGTHSLAFTPTSASFYVRLKSALERLVLVDSCTVESAGIVQLPTPWTAADLPRVRRAQSADVFFVACKNIQQRRIERRSARSWSVVVYLSDNGPFRTENTGPITVTPSAMSGNVTLAASKALFRATQVGGLFKIRSSGQRVSSNLAAANSFTNTVQVTGVGEQRRFAWTISGVWVGTVTLQRSIGTVGFWEDVADKTGNADESDNDGLDNQVVYYRLGFKAGNYTSGTAVCTITYTLGSITGIARLTAFTSSVLVDAEVIKDFGGTDASSFWSEASWSDRRGWPTSVGFYEGRLWWAGKNGVWGSVSDAYDSFDADTEGDSGPINRTIGSGPVDDINWILPLQRLILGAQGSEISVRSTTFDEPLSPSNFNIKDASTQGSAAVPAVKVDARGIYVQRAGVRVYELAFDTQGASYDYTSTDLTALVPELCSTGVVALAVQRQPDTRIHCVLGNGMAAVAVVDHAENVLSWQLVETDGVIEDVVVLPGAPEDSVYYVVNRPLGASGILAATRTEAGSGYTEVPQLVLSGGGGQNARLSAILYPQTSRLASGGSGYRLGDSLNVASGAAHFSVLTVDANGAITSLSLFGGTGLREGATPDDPAELDGGQGSGATVALDWGIDSVVLINSAGWGYESAPTVEVRAIDGNGTGAAVTVTVSAATGNARYLEKWALETECSGGSLNKQADAFIVYSGSTSTLVSSIVSSLSVVDGVGYTFPPTLTFSGGGGSGAAATVTLALVQKLLETLGSGYSVGDVLTLVGGTYTRPARLQVIAVFGGGQINGDTGVIIIDGGDYTVLPAHGATIGTVTGGTGSGATFLFRWGLGAATVSNPGSGYTSVPTVTVGSSPSEAAFFSGSAVPGSVTATIEESLQSGASTGTSIVTGLGHLEGKEVVAWGDGVDLSPDDENGIQRTYTVTSGAVALDAPVSEAIVGLPYGSRWVSTKLGLSADPTLEQRMKIAQLGLILVDTHIHSLKFGNSNGGAPAVLDNLPLVEAGAVMSDDTVYSGYDADMIEFPGEWATDNRLWLEAKAPRPCTILAAVMAIEKQVKQ